MKPQVLTTTKSAPVGLVDQLVAVELQQAEHPLAVDEVLGAAEADEGVGALGLAVAGSGLRLGLWDGNRQSATNLETDMRTRVLGCGVSIDVIAVVNSDSSVDFQVGNMLNQHQ